jgi:hypothetical protein
VLEAIVRRQINLALKGDQKAISFILAMEPQIKKHGLPIAKVPAHATAEELRKIYEARIRRPDVSNSSQSSRSVFRLGDRAHRNNIELGRFGHNRSNVWTYAGVIRSVAIE